MLLFLCKELTHSTLYFSPLPHSPPSLAVVDLLIYDKNIINVACIYRVGIINHSELLLLLISDEDDENFFIFPFLYCILFDHYSPSENCTMTFLCMSKAHKRNVSHKLDSEVINSQVHVEMSSISSSRRSENY